MAAGTDAARPGSPRLDLPRQHHRTTTMRSGFAAIVGRTGVGKSTLVNRLVGEKVSITAASTNTTRRIVRGVVNRPGVQIVLVDTPGTHRPRSALGRRLNATAQGALADEPDVVVLVVDGSTGVGPGDRFVAAKSPPGTIVALNKCDRMSGDRVLEALLDAQATLGLGEDAEYVPVSARSGKGVGELVRVIENRLPEGPRWFPEGITSDLPEELTVAELVREALLARLAEELPHSIACRVSELEWPRVRCEILVERPSQKAIVIGRRGTVLSAVRAAVLAQLPEGTRLELQVNVVRDWQARPERLGY